MQRGYAYLLAGILAFLLFLAIGLPARIVFDWLKPASVDFAGVSGSVWNGSASRIEVSGITLGASQWRFKPARILLGELSYGFAATSQGLPIEGTAGVRLNGSIRLRSVRGKIPVRAFDNIAPTGFFEGIANIDLPEVRLENGWPVRVSGQVELENLRLLAVQPALTLGTFKLTFAPQDAPPVTGVVSSNAGPLLIDGQLAFEQGRCYRLAAKASSRAGAGPEIQNVLAFLGPPGTDGRRVIERRDCL